jgi:hypothetical protein
MIKVIKTNLSTNGNQIIDHQSYVEEEESWEAFIEKVKLGFLFSKRKPVRVENIVCDDFHLSCDVCNSYIVYTKHFAYIEGRVVVE